MIKIISLLSICLLLTTLSFSQQEMPEIIKVGDNAPMFTIKTLNGNIFNTKTYKGKTIYINFFATWCGPCMKEMPPIEQKIWKEIKHKDFIMLAIGREHSEKELIKFKNEKQYTMPMAADSNRSIYSMFAPQMIPRNIVINKKGEIIYSKHGFDSQEFEAMIKLIKSNLD